MKSSISTIRRCFTQCRNIHIYNRHIGTTLSLSVTLTDTHRVIQSSIYRYPYPYLCQYQTLGNFRSYDNSTQRLSFSSKLETPNNDNTSNRPTLTTEEKQELQQWLSSFNKSRLLNSNIISQYFDIRHARSSGAGGQNVNKVNTKVDMRFSLYKAYQWLPSYVVQNIEINEQSRINNDNELIITSQRHRTQKQNYMDCIDKLYEIIQHAAYIPADTSIEKKQHIEALEKQSNERRIKQKKIQTNKRHDRNPKNWRELHIQC